LNKKRRRKKTDSQLLSLSLLLFTLYCGYRVARRTATCDPMKPAPPVMRMVRGV